MPLWITEYANRNLAYRIGCFEHRLVAYECPSQIRYRNLAYRISRSTGLSSFYYHSCGTNNFLLVSFGHVSKHRNHCSRKTALRGSPGQLWKLPNNNFVWSTRSLRTKPERNRFVSGCCCRDSSRGQHPLTYKTSSSEEVWRLLNKEVPFPCSAWQALCEWRAWQGLGIWQVSGTVCKYQQA